MQGRTKGLREGSRCQHGGAFRPGRDLGIAALAILGALGPSIALAQDALGVAAGEVTQSVQDVGNDVPLTAGRATEVRITPALPGSDPVLGVDALLHIYQDGQEIHESPLSSTNGPIDASPEPDPNDENSKLNFYWALPPASPNITMAVEFISPSFEGMTTPQPLGQTFVFSSLSYTTIAYVSVDYRPNNEATHNLPDAAMIAPGSGDSFFRAIYPIAGGDVTYYPSALPPYVFRNDLNEGGRDAELLFALGQIRRELTPTPTFLYGWTPSGAYAPNGISSPTMGVSFGNATPGRGESTFAHEMGHLFGLTHADGVLMDPNWGFDVNGLTGGPSRVKPPSLYGVMAAGLSNADRFFNKRELNLVLAAPVLSCAQYGIGFARSNPQEVLWVSGAVSRDPIHPGFLNPMFQLQAGFDPAYDCATGSGGHTVIVQDQNGQTLQRRSVVTSFETDSKTYVSQLATFGVSIPYSQNAARVILKNDVRGQVVDVIERSANSPQLALMPLGDELSGVGNIRWEASDPDGDPIRVSVEYSSDDGRTWVPLTVNAPANSDLRIDTRRWAHTHHARLRIYATDGFNTTRVVSPRFKVHPIASP